MKQLFVLSLLLVVLVACQPAQDNSAMEAFEKNAATTKAYLKGFQDENVDYSLFSSDFTSRDTGVGPERVYTLEEMKESDMAMLARYDFKLIGFDTLRLLPGVNNLTTKPDGSVRYYGDWEITKPATDSTEARSAILKAYESLDFDKEGKIFFQQIYGDFTGVMRALDGN